MLLTNKKMIVKNELLVSYYLALLSLKGGRKAGQLFFFKFMTMQEYDFLSTD